ncbi:MAG: glucose-1-phosphate adenylyltransferase [Firmicutes bacterium]|nr:glucose-1-phosphate adenylyltransferase [Bacillota bacterium]
MALHRKECVAMILAGGQGSRLGVLTKKVAKPAVPFGGKYRIIDFPLSNCANSGIDTVGVLTQYQPLALNAYVGIGSPWDLDRKSGRVAILPPYVRANGGEWYKGTANAVYQNIDFIETYNPDYVLVLSGDHIYRMDYSKMLDHHKEQGAAATIAVIEVPWEEASRFGIMNIDENYRIVEFVEKPPEPESNLASMGIYVFNWQVLRRYLIEDEGDPASANDFGKNIIPKMLANGEFLSAYPFQGYWKDVGTLDSLWEANMDMLGDNPGLDLGDRSWRIYSVNPTQPPQYLADTAVVQNSLVNEGCVIHGEVHNSVLFPGVTVEASAKVYDSVLMPNTKIGAGAVVHKAIVGNDTVIGEGSHIGEDSPQKELTVIGEELTIAPHSRIKGIYDGEVS